MVDLLKPQLAKEHWTSADALSAASDRLTEVEEEAEDREAWDDFVFRPAPAQANAFAFYHDVT